MKNLIFLLLLSFNSCSTSNTSLDTAKPKENLSKELGSIKDCICPQMWMPVCGEDGKTYSNACFAKCSNTKYTSGSCEKYFE